jgi:glutathione S-transferase
MKLYTFPFAPNPTKLQIFLGEKGIELERVLVNLPQGEQKSPDFLAKNPLGSLPVLELDDGTCIAQSNAIIEYLEELYPEPPMIGRTPRERLEVRSLERMIDTMILSPTARLVHATKSPLPGREPKPEIAAAAQADLVTPLEILDATIGDRPFAAGDHVSIADGTLFAAVRFGGMFGVEIDARHGNIHRWYDAFKQRPSAQ